MVRQLAQTIFTSGLVILACISHSSTTLVTWKPNKSFNLASSFKDNVVPCSKKTVVFPQSVEESIKIDASIAVSQLILPSYGDIELADGGTLFFGADSEDVNCTSETYSFYEDDSSSAWQNPGVWNSSRFNKATPDAERIPCFDDIVVFPRSAQFTVHLPDITQYVYGLIVDGKNLTTAKFLKRIFGETPGSQQFVLGRRLYDYPVRVSQDPCQSTSGCPCQTNGLKINCKLKYCPPPQCSNPIQPVGHCCKICGGSLLFEIDNFSMRAFKKLVKSIIDDYGADNFVYHVGMLPSVDIRIFENGVKSMPKRVQVVVMDKDEYTGTSSAVINEIGYRMSEAWIKNEKLVLLSGTPDSKTGLGVKIASSVFFAVVFAMSVMFAYYYRNTRIDLTELRNSFNVRGGMLTRVQRRSDSVVSLTRRDSNVSALRGSVGTAFRNPLYDSKRGRVVVAESAMEE